MTSRLPSTIGFAVLFAAAAACKASDPVGPHPTLAACTDTTSVATDIALLPGEVTVLTGSAQTACVRVPSTTAGADYVFVVTNADTKLDTEQGFTFPAQSNAAAAAGVAAAIAVADRVTPSPAVASAAGTIFAAPLGSEAAIRAYERTHLHHSSLASASRSGSLAARGALVPAAAVTAGQTLVLRVPSVDPKVDACTTYDSVSAVVKYVGQASIVAQDVNAPANGFTDADFQNIATEFDQKIYATDTSYFGVPTDIDANGKVILLFTPLINKATPKNSGSFFAGFFFAGDLFPRVKTSTSDGCKESNVGELFYLLVPDPTGTFSDPHSASSVRQLTRGTVAHEFQHMINAGIRLPNPNAPFEEVWLDEGLSHFAEEAVGRDERGFGDLQELSYNDVSAVPADFFAFFDQNLLRFGDWLQRPDTSSGPSVHADENLSSRGAAWAMLRYSADHYSGGNVRDFTRRLVAGPQTGIANLAARAGVPYATLEPDWAITNYADDLGIAGLDARYTYPSWRMRDAVARANSGTYPLRVTTISSSGTTVTGKVRSGAAAYFRYTPTGASPSLGVRFLDATGTAPATFTGARLVVLRVK